MAGFIRSLTDEDAATVADAMQEVAENGLQAARHLRREIYEVRADGERRLADGQRCTSRGNLCLRQVPREVVEGQHGPPHRRNVRDLPSG